MLERQPDAVDQLRIKIVIAIIGMNSIEFVMFVSIKGAYIWGKYSEVGGGRA